ncbi:MAG: FecR family protein [Bacteroidota bacterium]
MDTNKKDNGSGKKDEWDSFRSKIKEREKKSAFSRIAGFRLVRISAIIILLLLIAASVYYINYTGMFSSYPVRYHSADSIRKVVLPDETTVWLNKETILRSPQEFKGKFRKLKLEEGEAYFEVAPSQDQELIVEGQSAIARTPVGSFNYQSDDNIENVSLTVISGKLSFRMKGIRRSGWMVGPGQAVSYNEKERALEKSLQKNQNFLAWKEGWFRFNNASLNKIFGVLSDYYDTSFTFNEDLGADQLYSINFRTGEIEEVIAFLEHTIDIEIEKTGSSAYHVKKQD